VNRILPIIFIPRHQNSNESQLQAGPRSVEQYICLWIGAFDAHFGLHNLSELVLDVQFQLRQAPGAEGTSRKMGFPRQVDIDSQSPAGSRSCLTAT